MATPSSLNLVLNPNARKPRLNPPSVEAMRALLGPDSRVHVTQNLEELDRLMHQCREDDETLCFYGGDGSIGRGLTSLIRHRGEQAPLPPILAVRAGTINMVCGVLDLKEGVERTFQRWMSGELARVHEIPLMKVEVDGRPPHYGFVFAWGIGFRVLREYYERSPAPDVSDGVAVFLKTVLNAMHPKANSLPFFRAHEIGLELDGTPAGAAPLRSLTVGTIPRVSLGIRPFGRTPVKSGCFHATGTGLSLHRIVWHLPTMCFALGDLKALNAGDLVVVGENTRVLECTLTEGFTLDGEVFELSCPTRVKISSGPTVRFWVKS